METCYFCGEVCNNSTKIPLCHKCDDGTKTLEDTTVPICESCVNYHEAKDFVASIK